MKLKEVRQGSAHNADRQIVAGVTQDVIAKELGVDRKTIQRLKSLLKLDPAFQALISDGKINATTGFKALSKFSADEQKKVVEKLPKDIKLSDKDV